MFSTVLASHGHGGVRQFVLGSVTEEVLRLSAAPVLVVGPRIDAAHDPSTGPIVVCLDGSTFAESVLPAAMAWSSALESPLRLVTVIDPAFADIDRFVPDELVSSRYLADVTSRLEVIADSELLYGQNTARTIGAYAEELEAALVAVSTHGRTGWRRVTLGSVAMAIVHRARCSVLVVRSRTLDDGA